MSAALLLSGPGDCRRDLFRMRQLATARDWTVVGQARRYELPRWLVARPLFNVLIAQRIEHLVTTSADIDRVTRWLRQHDCRLIVMGQGIDTDRGALTVRLAV